MNIIVIIRLLTLLQLNSLFTFVVLLLGAALYRAHVGGWRRTAGGI
jgi:hypothetical protein